MAVGEVDGVTESLKSLTGTWGEGGGEATQSSHWGTGWPIASTVPSSVLQQSKCGVPTERESPSMTRRSPSIQPSISQAPHPSARCHFLSINASEIPSLRVSPYISTRPYAHASRVALLFCPSIVLPCPLHHSHSHSHSQTSPPTLVPPTPTSSCFPLPWRSLHNVPIYRGIPISVC